MDWMGGVILGSGVQWMGDELTPGETNWTSLFPRKLAPVLIGLE